MSVLQTGGSFNTEVLWQHSVGTAVAAGILAKRSQLSEAQAFTAGLLHDLGKLVRASVERAVYAELIRSSATALKAEQIRDPTNEEKQLISALGTKSANALIRD